MSIFPTKILLATDGSKEAVLASRTAADLAQSTSSELHVLYVGEAANPYAEEVGLAGDDRQARTVLDAEAEKVRAVGVGRGDRSWADSEGQQGSGGDQEGLDGQCLGLGGPACPLPGSGISRVRTPSRGP